MNGPWWVVNSVVAVWVAIAASPSVSSEPFLFPRRDFMRLFRWRTRTAVLPCCILFTDRADWSDPAKRPNARLAEDDLVHLLCSYVSVVESSLNRYGTRSCAGVLANAPLNEPTGVRAAEATTMAVVIWSLPVDVTCTRLSRSAP